MKRVSHSHPDGQPFRSSDEYLLCRPCSWCKVESGFVCVVGGHPTRRAHSVREDSARAQWANDNGRAPWPEDRVPGECYSTLPGCQA